MFLTTWTPLLISLHHLHKYRVISNLKQEVDSNDNTKQTGFDTCFHQVHVKTLKAQNYQMLQAQNIMEFMDQSAV